MRITPKRRRASSFVEVLIAVGVVSIVIIGIMASGTIARLSVEHRHRGDTYAMALRVLEWAETVPLSDDIGARFRDAFGDDPKFGTLTFSVSRVPAKILETDDDVSADLTVTVSALDGTGETKLTREVSRNAMRNAGELP